MWSKEVFDVRCERSGGRWICVEGEFKNLSFACSIVTVYAPISRHEKRDLLLEWHHLGSIPIAEKP